MDDRPYCYEFRFSHGAGLIVPDTTRMAMDSGDGPKYRHQDGNQEPCKTHPKISEEYGADAEWVEYKECE